MAEVALIVSIVLEHTQIGRFIYAVGSNSEAARLSGIRTARYLFGTLIAFAFLATLAAFSSPPRSAAAP